MQWGAAQKQAERAHENAKEIENLRHDNTIKEINKRGDNAINTENVKQKGRVAINNARINAAMAKEMFRQAEITARRSASKRTIVLSDGNVYDYDKSREGALLSVYNDLVDSLPTESRIVFNQAKTSTQKISLLQEYAKLYPDLDDDIKKAIGTNKPKAEEEEDDEFADLVVNESPSFDPSNYERK
jgi:hypothetical protein